MKIGKNGLTVLEKRYLVKDEEGKMIETVEGLFDRVANAIADADLHFDSKADTKQTAKEFRNMMTELEFLPNSPTLMNAGRPLGQLSACFVLPVGDSMEEIFEAIKQAALIHKSGGGTGFSFSRLRASGSTVKTTGGVASGPVSFMRVFNMATEAVKQGGTRRGANMGILRVDHPDILQFIDCKKDNADITNFNISVGVTEEFMEAALKGEDYPLYDPRTKLEIGKLNAQEVFDKIVDNAWRNGEPGIIFLDRLNRDNVVPSQGEIESTNPCGEQPLLPYESCNLGSINLLSVLKMDKDGTYVIDYEKLKRIVNTAVHFLDNVIEVNRYPLELIDKTTKATRKIGLGVMGWADMLLRMGIAYNSDEAVVLAEKVMGFINENGRKASHELAKTRGSFPLFSESVFASGAPLRNATVTTIAPTGTLSILAGCSSGVEPVFAFAYIRNVMDNTEMIETNPILKQVLVERGIYSDKLMKEIIAEGSLQHLPEIPEDIKRVFVCSHDISPMHHIKMQAAFQRHTDNAVSKTVNFTHDATREDVREAYIQAYKLDCKGVTIYRDGSRDSQVLNIGSVQKDSGADKSSAKYVTNITPRPRPEAVNGMTERMKIGCGNLYVTVNYDENGICEVFTNTGKAGGCPSQSEATARLASVALRSGVSVDEVIDQLKGIRCPSTIRQPGMKCTSCPDAMAKIIRRVADYQKLTMQNTDANQIPPIEKITKQMEADAERYQKLAKFCPECGAEMEHEGGCVSCRSCGYSKCN
ncbi:ribonucleoside-diphosphate reductase class II [Hydrogenoanaerobacterium saccharovorans]|uniref:Vitamin B12-dependent ribonucleotide reductase n=1 Tax=Hydrogenoanaerobacterium saccharovorans TaxID=474960 RepID=A0A1H8ACI6_9FIRM|nr:vitamin B12-dependent ribonucleotide reductase [Hydrogenoanaerobacterium saccharovorans]RPF48066.1 ribonucleoside-diphosphate reductase class II [Hydrogenoanaerobacterium saccharovorans]SEM67528.1 ribonucleoside-diphosphate reductase class II [Hydrogenoanaerobacterium saccharovorans]